MRATCSSRSFAHASHCRPSQLASVGEDRLAAGERERAEIELVLRLPQHRALAQKGLLRLSGSFGSLFGCVPCQNRTSA